MLRDGDVSSLSLLIVLLQYSVSNFGRRSLFSYLPQLISCDLKKERNNINKRDVETDKKIN